MDRTFLTDIYRFWFGDENPGEITPEKGRYWMHQNDDTDRDVREKFGHLIVEAACGEWHLEGLSREEGVALVVLFDQFPRNIFRTSGEAYAYDHLARAITRRLVAAGWERFTAAERFFLGLTYVHHEDMADQDHAVMLSALEAVKAPECDRTARRVGLDQATRHGDVIRKFGRFPHRNAMLGRQSTPEELAFMAAHGRGF